MSELREKIETIISNSVDRIPSSEPFYENIILRVGEAADQILAAIEEGIEICELCEADSFVYRYHCDICGGKGWRMK